MTFGEKIQNLRKDANISQEELSFQLKVSRQAISKWENDNGYPETEKIIKMSKIFGVTLDYLLNEDENQKTDASVEENGIYISREKADGFIFYQISKYRKIGLAVAIFISGMTFVFVPIDLGIILYLISIVAGIALLVSVKLSDNPYLQIWTEPLLFDTAYKKELKKLYEEKKKKYDLLVIVGTILIPVGFVVSPMMGVMLDGTDIWMNISLGAGMIISGVGTYLCIYFMGILRSYRRLVNNNNNRK